MDTWIYLSQGFAVAMTPENLVIALIGCFVGTIVGLLPGLGPINGVAILLPLAFALHLPAESALILLAMAIMVIVVPPVLRWIRRRQHKPQPDIG